MKHGVFSPRALAAEAEEAADMLMALPRAVPIDRVAAVEIGRLLALIGRIDEALAKRGVGQRTRWTRACGPAAACSGGSMGSGQHPITGGLGRVSGTWRAGG